MRKCKRGKGIWQFANLGQSEVVQVLSDGKNSVYLTSEEALRQSGLQKRKAVVTNKAENADGSKDTKTAVFTFNGAGDWVNGIKKVFPPPPDPPLEPP